MPTTVPGDYGLSRLEREALAALVERHENGEPLSGLRCGTAVCEPITALADRGLIHVDRIERENGAWRVDVTLADGLTRQMDAG